MRLEAEQIELDAGAFHLGPLSLYAADGEYLVILGPTGAGKTLTLEAIAGLRPVAAGRIAMDGRDVTRAAPEDRRAGFLYQDSLLFPHLSVRGNVAYGAHRIPRRERAAAIARIAKMLEIEPLLDRMPRGLSGGERQRVAIARALAANPKLMLLDEPMAALDPNSRYALRQTLLGLHRELGTTTVHVTHSFTEARELADRIAILIGGRVLQTGAPREVFSRPQAAQIARFLRSSTLAAESIEPAAAAPVIRLHGLTIHGAGAPGGAEMPELVAAGAAFENGGADAADLVPARVVSADTADGRLHLRLSAGLDLEATIGGGSVPAGALAAGSSVWLRIAGD